MKESVTPGPEFIVIYNDPDKPQKGIRINHRSTPIYSPHTKIKVIRYRIIIVITNNF